MSDFYFKTEINLAPFVYSLVENQKKNRKKYTVLPGTKLKFFKTHWGCDTLIKGKFWTPGLTSFYTGVDSILYSHINSFRSRIRIKKKIMLVLVRKLFAWLNPVVNKQTKNVSH